MTLCREQGFAYYLAWGTIMQGWALTAQGQGEEGMAADAPRLGRDTCHRAQSCDSRTIWRYWPRRAGRQVRPKRG